MLGLFHLNLAKMIATSLGDSLGESAKGFHRGIVTPDGHVLPEHHQLSAEPGKEITELDILRRIGVLADAKQKILVQVRNLPCLGTILRFSSALLRR